MTYKTTKKDFAEFKKECEYWIEYFGMKDWEVEIAHEDAKGNRAQCWTDTTGKICTLRLGLSWNNSPLKNEIKKCAFHEVCELLLTQLDSCARSMFADQYVAEYTHDVIRRLENTIFKEHRG